MSKIINLTPHDVVYSNGNVISFPKTGNVARINIGEKPNSPISFNGVELETFTPIKGEVVGLPAPQEDTFYIVSMVVFDNTPRRDAIAPDTGKTAIRNEKGQIMAVTRFKRKSALESVIVRIKKFILSIINRVFK